MNPSFRTNIKNIPSPGFTMHHGHAVFSIGSCFSGMVGKRLSRLKFICESNPMGVVFHPEAILNQLKRIQEKRYYKITDIVQSPEGFYHVWDAQWRSETAQELMEKLNYQIHYQHEMLQNTSVFIFTFGTAWGYERTDSQEVVANCHKWPQQNFSKILSPFIDLVEVMEDIQKRCWQMNPEAKVVFTVSPIRHLKDGFVENQRSKSLLISAIHESKINDKNYYFPAYEIMMDDLRDYRFYTDDMLHPTSLAEDYIFQIFSELFFNDGTLGLNQEIHRINQSLAHRIQTQDEGKVKDFITQLMEKMKEIEEVLPGAFEQEIEDLLTKF